MQNQWPSFDALMRPSSGRRNSTSGNDFQKWQKGEAGSKDCVTDEMCDSGKRYFWMDSSLELDTAENPVLSEAELMAEGFKFWS